mgnify:CR=1 FL=1
MTRRNIQTPLLMILPVAVSNAADGLQRLKDNNPGLVVDQSENVSFLTKPCRRSREPHEPVASIRLASCKDEQRFGAAADHPIE